MTLDAAIGRGRRRVSALCQGWRPSVAVHQEGRVCASSDGVVLIDGLPAAAIEDVVEIGPGRAPALVLGLSALGVRAALLEDAAGIQEGDRVTGGGGGLRIGVGEGLLGRVVDPLGGVLDGQPAPTGLVPVAVERPAPPLSARSAIREPMHTGVLTIDAMFPIGRGQRELILGDAGTGRTTLAITALLRQATTNVVGVYVAIGRRRAEVWRIVEELRRGGGRWVVVVASDDASPGARYLAPFSATTIAEHFRDKGEHALIVYDDLTSHAKAWRELSLLLGRPPGREAFPGDVFYLHARLLERSTQLAPEHSGGSLTALPIATTEDGRLSAYIPTNLISITDGQLVLSASAFAEGDRPAIDVGLSVSRVGSKAQQPTMRKLAGRLGLDFASFLELEAFSRVGARLEPAAQRRLDVGLHQRTLLRAEALEVLGPVAQLVRLALATRPDALLGLQPGEAAAAATEIEAGLPPALREALGQDPVPDTALTALRERIDERTQGSAAG